MVVDDKDFGELVGYVKAIDARLSKMESEVSTVIQAYYEAKGAGQLLTPFWHYLVPIICSVFGAGLVIILLRSTDMARLVK